MRQISENIPPSKNQSPQKLLNHKTEALQATRHT